MSKKVILCSPKHPGTSQHTESIDWSLCCLCQRKTNSALVNPLNGWRFDVNIYDRLEDRLQRLNELNALPHVNDIKLLDDGDGISKTLQTHSAVWHKKCFDMCNEAKITRALKRSSAGLQSNCENSPIKKRCMRSLSVESSSKVGCFFCNEEKGAVHKVETLTLDSRIRELATELQDTHLLAKMAIGDMAAKDAVYHKNCLTSFYNRYRSYKRKSTSSITNIETMENKATAFAELVSYIENYECIDKNENPIFKLSELNKMYINRLKQLGTELTSNSTNLKNKLLLAMPSLVEHKTNYETMLSFREQIGNSLLAASQSNFDNDTLVLMRAANIIRKCIFKRKYQFSGSLKDEQYDDELKPLKDLVDMILHGNDITNETETADSSSEVVKSLMQLIVFNAMKRKQKNVSYNRHIAERETRLPLYLGLLIHGKTRKRELIDILHDKGLCISYQRVMQLSTNIANSVITQYEESNVVCPSFLKNNVFMTGNLDNIDHNPSSNTSTDAFHGTAISLTQHVTESESGSCTKIELDMKSTQDMKTTKSLPNSYTDIPPVTLKNNFPSARKLNQNEDFLDDNDITTQTDWLSHVHDLLQSNNLGKDQYISWSSYFATKTSLQIRPPAISALLPLFNEEAHSVAMIKHGMNIVREATCFKNPGQIPVLTVDQPLYVLAKKIQWTWPSEFGEDKYVVLLGGLHIEIAILKCIGDWLEGSGWLSALTGANVLTSGRAEVVQRGTNISRGQWIHQVMASALYMLKQKAYKAYTDKVADEIAPEMSFEMWSRFMTTDGIHPQFLYWNTTLHLELLFLQFLKSQRDADFERYKQALRQLLPWMFALDHVHYARWLTVHLQDLDSLEADCPGVHKEFKNGKFVTQRTERKFSCIAHDQVHEQLNALIKGDGGFVGITENQETLNRWTVSAPELMRILAENENKSKRNTSHHEQGRSSQNRFFQQTRSLVSAFEDLGNPFTEESLDLIALDSNVVMTAEAVKSVKQAEYIGKEQFNQFRNESLNGSGSIYDPIKKHNLQLFRAGGKSMPSNVSNKLKNLKTDVQLFSRMYIASQNRDGDLDLFFQHENHPWPPSLAEQNRLRSGNKADLVTCLEANVERCIECPNVEVKIIDGAALIQILDPKKSRTKVQTFEEYANKVFLPCVSKHLNDVQQVHVIWDIYKEASLKGFTRQLRGSGEYIRVTNNTKLPTNWKYFLRNDKNKTQLFHFLADCLKSYEIEPGKVLLTTSDNSVLSSNNIHEDEVDLTGVQPCDHEEADTRLVLHASHAFRQGKKSVLIYATDTDVLVIAIALASEYKNCTLWLGFGHANSFRYIPVHTIVEQLGPDKSRALLFLHSFSGCDTVSYFNGVGKKTAFRIWLTQPEFVSICKKLSNPGVVISDEDIKTIERFVVLLYAKTASYETVNEARKHLFSQKGRMIENIPPSRSALEQHIYRAAYQAAYVWGQMDVSIQGLPSPSEWGWKKENDIWVPLWSVLPEASKDCRELIKCNCRSACSGRCKCLKANLPCTYLCFCEAGCDR